jgi:prepilin-type processing-associated H-X9-DG protein
MSTSSDSPQKLNYAVPSLVEPTRKWGVVAGAVGFTAITLLAASQLWLPAYYTILAPAALFVGIAAVLIGVLGTASGRSRLSRLGLVLSIGGLALGGMAASGSVLMPSPWRFSSCSSPRVSCGSNLRQLGQAMILYANENGGRFPATIADLLTQDITSRVFVCPSTNDTEAAMAQTPQATAANVTAGGHLSYVITCAGFRDPPPVNAILAYEPLANHGNSGMNVLFGDGHVEWLLPSEARKLLAELKAGHNPPRAEAMK